MISPLKDNVLIRLVEKERVTAGGIALPDTAESQYGKDVAEADVIRCGPGAPEEGYPMEVSPGDRVLLGQKGTIPGRLCGESIVTGRDLKQESSGDALGGELRMVRCAEIVGVIE